MNIQMVTVRQTAQALGMSEDRVYDLVRAVCCQEFGSDGKSGSSSTC